MLIPEIFDVCYYQSYLKSSFLSAHVRDPCLQLADSQGTFTPL